MFTTKDMLDIAIRFEKNGEAVYRKALKQLANRDMAEMLKWIADEEVRHREWFTKIRDSVDADEDSPLPDEISQDLFQEFIGKQAFSLEDVDFRRTRSPGELIEIFIEFEQDTILFYELIEPFVQEKKASAQLRAIITEEKEHIRKLAELLDMEESDLVAS